jgi:hypothetical protein
MLVPAHYGIILTLRERCASTGQGGTGNRAVFPVSRFGQRSGRRAPKPSVSLPQPPYLFQAPITASPLTPQGLNPCPEGLNAKVHIAPAHSRAENLRQLRVDRVIMGEHKIDLAWSIKSGGDR